MNIQKGKISNLNKKLIAGLLAITLSAPLFGCNDVEQNYGLNYTIGSEGQYIYQNTTFDSMKNYKVVIFECDCEQTAYLTEVVLSTLFNVTVTEYYNVFGSQLLYWSNSKGSTSSSALTIEEEYDFIDYLIINNEVQQEYTEAELKEIIQKIELDYKSQKDKQLVKE